MKALLTLFFLSPLLIAAQAVTFHTTYGTSVLCMRPVSNNGYAAPTGRGLMKTDAHGNVLWSRHFSKNAIDAYGTYFDQNTNGDYFFGGAYVDSVVLVPGLIIRTDSIGNLVWSRSLSSPGNYVYIERVRCTDDSVLICGQYDDYPFVLKLDANGDTIWTRQIHFGTATGSCTALQPLPGGNCMAAGWLANPPGYPGCFLAKLDANGDTVFVKRYLADSLTANSVSCAMTSDGGFVLTGATPDGYALLRTDSLGNILWMRHYGSSSVTMHDPATDAVETGNGDLVVLGYTHAFGYNNHAEPILFRVDASGDSLRWAYTYWIDSGATKCVTHALEPTSDGGFLFGTATLAGVVKTDSAGQLACAQVPVSLIAAPDSAQVFAGAQILPTNDVQNAGFTSAPDTITAQRICSTGFPESIAEPAAEEGNIYPNPSAGDFIVQLPETHAAIQLYMYDAQGRLVQKQRIDHNIESITLHTDHPGLYLIYIVHDDHIVLIRRLIRL